MHSSPAHRYAKALIEAAETLKTRQQTDAEIQYFDAVFKERPELPHLLNRISSIPESGAAVARYLIETLEVSRPMGNLIRMLAQRKRLGLLPEIARAFLKECRRQAGLISARVTSVRNLDRDECDRIRERLHRITGQKVEIEWNQDPSLMGGIMIRMGDRVIDGTLAAQLNRLKGHMLNY
ncbi:ATP synthase F1 subunit delta [bacterium]|nr:ATP synthase F1 subunit delta [candidate division CSSED10-310 bacterium]